MMAALSRLGFPVFVPLVAALFCLPVSAATPDDDVREWMGRMSSALQELNYEGIFVHRSKDQMSAMHVRHLVDEQGEHEYLTTLTGVERRVVRASNSGFGSIPKDDAEGIARYWDSIEGNYELLLAGRDRVAGRFTKVVIVKPKDQYRYGYRLWLEETTGLLLKSDLLNVAGDVIEQVMFTSIKLLDKSEITHPPVEPTKAQEDGSSASDTDPRFDIDAWQVGQLASGFSLVDVHKAGPSQSVQRMTFSDGLASLSVFIEKMSDGDKPFEGISRRGAVSAFGAVVDGYQVTVVGEVPEATVKMIGQSIKPKSVEE